jgi:formamidopyrimidine-DNA glycosylase
MPELPEVETCRRIVERELSGLTIAQATLRLPKLMRFSPVQDLDVVVGRQLLGARRTAKVLTVDLSDQLSLVMHLKLSGQIAVHRPGGARYTAGHPVPDPAGDYPHKTTHLEFGFDDGSILYFSDLRQFGWMRLVPTTEVEALIGSFEFGPDAVDDASFTPVMLASQLSRRGVPVKTVLLDQKVVGGIGNIYVDEALHRAGIHPALPSNALTAVEIDRVFGAIGWAMERGLEQGGAKIVHGKAYPVDGFPAVHARAAEPCFACATPIVKIRVGQRGTYLCPVCQPTTIDSAASREAESPTQE